MDIGFNYLEFYTFQGFYISRTGYRYNGSILSLTINNETDIYVRETREVSEYYMRIDGRNILCCIDAINNVLSICEHYDTPGSVYYMINYRKIEYLDNKLVLLKLYKARKLTYAMYWRPAQVINDRYKNKSYTKELAKLKNTNVKKKYNR